MAATQAQQQDYHPPTFNGHTTTDIALPNGQHPLQTFPGPTAKGKSTTLTLFNRSQLIFSRLLPSLEHLINSAWVAQHDPTSTVNQKPRLRYEGHFLERLGEDPDTFLFLISTNSDDDGEVGDLIATAFASRYEGVAEWPEGPGVERVWQRLGLVEEGTEAWELHMMAVSPDFQRQGLADFLLGVVDWEIARRGSGRDGQRQVLYISTLKEANYGFYVREGFVERYCVKWPKGHWESKGERGFTITHMDRVVRVEGEGRGR